MCLSILVGLQSSLRLCMWLFPRHSLLVIDGFSSWTSPRIPVVETVLAKLWLCHSLVGSMSACHMAKHTVVMASTTLMSTSLCWWGAAHLFNCLCNGCSLLAISAKTLPSSLLCSLRDCLYCIDQVAENGISSVKATFVEGEPCCIGHSGAALESGLIA